MSFTYRVDKTYDWNYENGPSYSGTLPEVPATPEKTFFGYPVNSRIGIAAGLLLNSKWIGLYAQLGFDIVTYKTVRSSARQCQPPPNWVFLDAAAPLDPDSTHQALVRRDTPPADVESITSSVSFGIPSKDPAVWQEDVARARDLLGPGQVLVVSVVASPTADDPPSRLVDDFGQLAELAAEANAQVIEANLSCPNVRTSEGQVYLDAELASSVSKALRQGAGDLPVLLKCGFFRDERALAELLRSVAPNVDGVVLVNCIARPILNADGSPAFGPGREVAGVIGSSIREPCLANLGLARSIVEREGLGLEVAAVGGVLDEVGVQAYFDAGAYAVLMGGAPMYDPHIALRFKTRHPEW